MKFFHLQMFLLALLPMALTDGQGEARRIAMIDPDKIKASLDYGAIEEIIESRPEVNGLPTAVVSIAGVARSGKSFLLNLMAHLLEHIETDNDAEGWEKSNLTIGGINWAQNDVIVTQGIWMWNRPFIVARGDGRKVAILLVDTQGTGDNTRSLNLNTLVTFLSLQISTIQMLNVWKYLTSNDLELLKLCSDYRDLEAKDDSYLFRSIIFVIRDYQGNNKLGRDDSVLQSIIDQKPDNNTVDIINGLSQAFRHVTSYKLPSPGSSIETASVTAKDWKLDDVKPEFLRIAKELLINSKQHGDVYWPTGTELLEHLKHVELLFKKLPEILNSSREALEISVLFKGFNDALNKLRQITDELSETESLKKYGKDKLVNLFDQRARQVINEFEGSKPAKKYSDSAWYKAYISELIKEQDICRDRVETKMRAYTAENTIAWIWNGAITAAIFVGSSCLIPHLPTVLSLVCIIYQFGMQIVSSIVQGTGWVFQWVRENTFRVCISELITKLYIFWDQVKTKMRAYIAKKAGGWTWYKVIFIASIIAAIYFMYFHLIPLL